ncbi:MAG: hypothetical protein J6L00_05640, partial [Clostridia bacterium]|nr:hypothetical protein [Clostridia bacterium]
RGVTVVLDTTLTPALIEEGFVREIISKLQTMRKEAGFEVTDHITVYVDGNENIGELVSRNADTICDDVLADGITLGEIDGFVKEWDINGEKVTFGVKR